MYDNDKKIDHEVDLREFIAIIWAHKFFLTIFTASFIFVAGYYSLTAEKRYTAKAIFEIDGGDNSGFNLPGEMGAIAALAGLGDSANSGSELLLERLSSRQFILQASTELNFEDDKFFNRYKPNGADPVWKAFIKSLIGWKNKKADPKAMINQSIVTSFGKFVTLEKTDAGALSIEVIHKKPGLAAKYANSLMDLTRKLVENEERISTDLRLSYLSQTLADALGEVEETQQNLKDFALKNSARAQESFLSGSLKLDELRMEHKEAKEISYVLEIISELIRKKNLNENSYQDLRLNYPLVDDVRFRRILGMSETISAWSWPDYSTIEAVAATLSDRISRLDVEISDMEGDAQVYASSAEEMAGLMREAKIAEATYTVLIEQVKSQSLAAGFKPETFKVFEYATPPLSPSAPQRSLLLVLGALMGLFLGSLFAFINAVRRGAYYTSNSINLATPNARFLRTSIIRRVSRRPLEKISELLARNKYIVLDEAMVELANQKLVYVMNAGGRPSAFGIAQVLATKSASSGRKVAFCNINIKENETINGEKSSEISGLDFIQTNVGVNILKLEDKLAGVSFFTAASFEKNLNNIIGAFDQVYVCSSEKESIVGLTALRSFNPMVILLTRLKKTRKLDIDRIQSIQPVGILFND